MTVVGGRYLPGLCRSIAVQERTAFVACGHFGIKVVDLLYPNAPRVLDTLHLGGLVVDVKVRRDLLIALLSGKRLRAYRQSGGLSLDPMAALTTSRWPVQAYLNGDRLHVAEVGLLRWLSCLAGVRCGFGDRVEVAEVDELAGTAGWLGEYGGAWSRMPYARGTAGYVVAPTRRGFEVLRAQEVP
jgi:hypothetical protein